MATKSKPRKMGDVFVSTDRRGREAKMRNIVVSAADVKAKVFDMLTHPREYEEEKYKKEQFMGYEYVDGKQVRKTEMVDRTRKKLVNPGSTWPSQPAMDSRLQSFADNPAHKDGWSGGSGITILDGLRNGFRSKEFIHSAEYVMTAEKKRAVWDADEGEVDVGRLIDGKDDYFYNRGERPKKPGLRVQAEFAFSAGVQNSVIRDYGAWIAGLLGSLEKTGYSLEVDLWIPLRDLYQGDRGIQTNVLIRVKKHNEVSNFTDWSAFFAPYGYRVLGFSAKCLAGDLIGKTATSSLGHCISGTWDLKYDKENATVMITADQMGYSTLATEALTQKAVDAGLIPGLKTQDKRH